jgi:hypothetical protein
VAKHHNMRCVGVEVMLNEFLTSALDIGEWLELRSGHLAPGYAQDDRLIGSQSQCYRIKSGIRRIRCKRVGEHWTLSGPTEQSSLMRTPQQVWGL